MMTKAEKIEDLKVMIAADRDHLREADRDGNTVAARGFAKAIEENREELRKLLS